MTVPVWAGPWIWMRSVQRGDRQGPNPVGFYYDQHDRPESGGVMIQDLTPDDVTPEDPAIAASWTKRRVLEAARAVPMTQTSPGPVPAEVQEGGSRAPSRRGYGLT
jgi:hypothetical protein